MFFVLSKKAANSSYCKDGVELDVHPTADGKVGCDRRVRVDRCWALLLRWGVGFRVSRLGDGGLG